MDCTAGGRQLTGLMNYRLGIQKRAEPRSAAPQRRSPGFITLPAQSKTRAYGNGTDAVLLVRYLGQRTHSPSCLRHRHFDEIKTVAEIQCFWKRWVYPPGS